MNKLSRDISQGEIVIADDGAAFEVHGGNGMRHANMGRKVFAFPYDVSDGTRIGDLCEISGDINPELTKLYNEQHRPQIAGTEKISNVK